MLAHASRGRRWCCRRPRLLFVSSQSGFFESRGPPEVVKVDASKSSTTTQLDLDRVRDYATTRRRLYKASGGAADGRTKTHVTPTNNTKKGKKRGSSSIGEKREVKMCRIFFPRINFLFLTFFIFDSFFVRAKFRPPLLLNTFVKSVVRLLLQNIVFVAKRETHSKKSSTFLLPLRYFRRRHTRRRFFLQGWTDGEMNNRSV